MKDLTIWFKIYIIILTPGMRGSNFYLFSKEGLELWLKKVQLS